MSSRRKKGQATFKSFQSTVAEKPVQEESTEALREEQVEAVKKFAAPAMSNPYQSLPAVAYHVCYQKVFRRHGRYYSVLQSH